MICIRIQKSLSVTVVFDDRNEEMQDPLNIRSIVAAVQEGIQTFDLVPLFNINNTQSESADKLGVKMSELSNQLVWIDLEMSGLDLKKDHILEIACIITNGDLEIVAKSEDLVINHPVELLDGMNDWCKNSHSLSGLSESVLKSTITLKDAEEKILSFIKQHVSQPGVAILAGNSIHVDKQFLLKDMPSIPAYLHYRLVDVSTVKELCSRWYPQEFSKAPKKTCSHRALADIEESIAELNYYRKAIMKN